jgi:hypothetical protein
LIKNTFFFAAGAFSSSAVDRCVPIHCRLNLLIRSMFQRYVEGEKIELTTILHSKKFSRCTLFRRDIRDFQAHLLYDTEHGMGHFWPLIHSIVEAVTGSDPGPVGVLPSNVAGFCSMGKRLLSTSPIIPQTPPKKT